jgi:hypothetical protein
MTALGRIAAVNSIGILQPNLADADSWVRFATFTALNRIGRALPSAWPEIVAGLASSSPGIRSGTRHALRDTVDPELMVALARLADAPGPAGDVAIELLGDATVGAIAAEALKKTLLMFDAFHDVKEKSDKGWPSVDFEIAVPAGLEMALDAKSGDVRADGDGFATSSVTSSFGNVRIENVRGDVVASSSSGKVSVANVKGDSIDAHSGFGDVALVSIESTKVTVNTSSGNVKLADGRTSKAVASPCGETPFAW